MKVLQIVQQPQRRGAEMFAYDLTTELLRNGHDVRTVYLYPAMSGDNFPTREGDVMLDADPGHPFEKLLGVQPAVLWKLLSVVASFEPDIVQANGARTLKYGAALRRGSFRHRFGFVYRSIGDPLVWVRGRVKRAIFRQVLIPAVDGIAAVSTGSLDGLRQLYRLDGKVVAQIPRGIDPARLAPHRSRSAVRAAVGTSEAAPMVLYVGSLTAEKRVDRLARVFAQVVSEVPAASLAVLGEGPERRSFEALLADLSISDRVNLVGASDDVGSYLAAADVLLLTSDTEGLPGVVLEAASHGVPSVSTRVGGVEDAVTNGVDGLLADPADEAELAANVVSLLSDEERRGELGGAARERFESTYAITVVAAAYLDLYQAVAAAADSKAR